MILLEVWESVLYNWLELDEIHKLRLLEVEVIELFKLSTLVEIQDEMELEVEEIRLPMIEKILILLINKLFVLISPETSNLWMGVDVPIPILLLEEDISILSIPR